MIPAVRSSQCHARALLQRCRLRGPLVRSYANIFNGIEESLSAEKVRELAQERERIKQELHRSRSFKKTQSAFKRTEAQKNQYSSTLLLPKKTIPIKREGQNSEHIYRPRTTDALYKWQDQQIDRPSFIFPDGPPYANGSLHLGHCVNKILKDTINRYQLLQGKRVHYVPGWDCHGLPIETLAASSFPGLSPNQVPPLEMRSRCRDLAGSTLSKQKEEFRALGIMADWSPKGTYRTMDLNYEMKQLRLFGEMVRKGLITRAFRPVFWSPSSRTALAESELKMDPNFFVRSVYVRFPLNIGPSLRRLVRQADKAGDLGDIVNDQINAVIWTTTPWSLPSNMAVNINPELSYSIVKTEADEVFVLATERVEAFKKIKLGLSVTKSSSRPVVGDVEELLQFPGSALLDSTYRHPFLPTNVQGYPIIPAAYVTADVGTGVVHSAPAHGSDDYLAWKTYERANPKVGERHIINPIDGEGKYTEEIEKVMREADVKLKLSGLTALGSGGKMVTRFLDEGGWLLGEAPLQHSYPLDWRTNLPILVRATMQWFADLASIKEKAIKALRDVRFVPESGRARLEAIIRTRDEWCISRQRAWGVPIPVVYNADTDEALLTPGNVEHIISVLQTKGTDYWWQGNPDEFVAPAERKEGVRWRKGTDTMDVWFDSGSSWSMLPATQEHQNVDTNNSESYFSSPPVSPADVYLEGSDQHRGWFQSSLLTFVATSAADEPAAPFRTVITHAFTVDRKGKKMSKSEGNVISPQVFLQGGPKTKDPVYGADGVRWWIGRIDYTKDITVTPLVVRHANDELRKVRNTLRFLLSYVSSSQNVAPMEQMKLGFVERWMLHNIRQLNLACQQAYDNHDFAEVTRRLAEACHTLISARYIAISKDILYNDAEQDSLRQAILMVLDQSLRTVLAASAPLVPHLAEEVWTFYNGAETEPKNAFQPASSFFQSSWPQVPAVEDGEAVTKDMGAILKFRDSLLAKLEEVRQMKALKASSEVQVKLLLSSDTSAVDGFVKEVMMRRRKDLARIFGVSYVDLVDQLPNRHPDDLAIWPQVAVCPYTGLSYAVEPSRHQECPRCWTFIRKADKKLCERCEQVVCNMPAD